MIVFPSIKKGGKKIPFGGFVCAGYLDYAGEKKLAVLGRVLMESGARFFDIDSLWA